MLDLVDAGIDRVVDGVRAEAVHGDLAGLPMRLVNEGRQLLPAVGGHPRHRVHRAPAASHHLDEVGAELDHVADLAAELVLAIRFPSEVPGMAPGDGDGLPAGLNTRADAVAELQGAAEMDDRAAKGAEVAHGGDTRR
jgi:hypothetical protein